MPGSTRYDRTERAEGSGYFLRTFGRDGRLMVLLGEVGTSRAVALYSTTYGGACWCGETSPIQHNSIPRHRR